MFATTHWTRKHMGEIASTARQCTARTGLSASQRQTLELAERLARSVASGAKECSHDNALLAVTLLCAACREGLPGQPSPRCQGRHDWRSPCDLIAGNVLVECQA